MTEDVEKINQAVATAETFSNLYYKKLDNERHTIDKMYHENATMTWNGNPIEGIQNIQKFFILKDVDIFVGLYPSDDFRVVLHEHFVVLRGKISTMFIFSGFSSSALVPACSFF